MEKFHAKIIIQFKLRISTYNNTIYKDLVCSTLIISDKLFYSYLFKICFYSLIILTVGIIRLFFCLIEVEYFVVKIGEI